MDPRVEVEIARRYLVNAWQSGMQVPGNIWFCTLAQQCKTEGAFADGKPRWHTLPDRILTASPHLQGYDVPGDEIDRLKAQGLTLLEALDALGIG